MNPDTQLRVTSTHSAREFAGSVFGIETPRFIWVSAALALGFLLFAWLHYGHSVSFGTAFLFGMLPALACAGFIVIFLQDRPPRFLLDLIESLLNGGNASPLSNGPFSPLPDVHLANGLIFHGGPRTGGSVAKGFWIEAPALHSASSHEANRFSETRRQLLRLLPEGYTLHVAWWVESDCRGPLDRYRKETERTTNPLVKLTRNLHFLLHSERMRQRKLRRQRAAIFIYRSLDRLPRTPMAASAATEHYDETVQQLAAEFARLEQELAALFAPQGGRVSAMNDADHYRLFARKLNPSFAERPDYDPVSALDSNQSIVQSAWNSELCGQGKQGFLLDGFYHGVLQLRRWPSQTYPTLIYKLTELPFGDYELHVRVERLPVQKVIAQEQKAQDRISRQLAEKHDERLVVSHEQKGQRVHRLSGGSLLPVTVEVTVIVRAKTPEQLAQRILAFKSVINGLNGAQYYEATSPASARNVFFATLPGVALRRRSSLKLYGEDTFVADMLPLSASFEGHLEPADAIYSGAHGNLVGIRIFARDGTQTTPVNMLVLGATGVGKSMLVQDLLQQSEPGVAYTVIIEEGLSHAAYARSFGVEPICIRLDGADTINVLGTSETAMNSFHRASITAAVARMVGLPADEDKARKRKATIAKFVARLCDDHAEDWMRRQSDSERLAFVREILALHRWGTNKGMLTHESLADFRVWQENNPAEATVFVQQVSDADVREFEATQSQLLREFVFSRLAPEEHLTLSSLREYLELNADGAEKEECEWLATMLTPWCQGGSYGCLFDGPSTVSLEGPVVHFELGGIPEAAREVKELVGFIIINYVRQHLLSMPRHLPKRICVEEMSRFLDVPGGDKLLREFFEQFRKFTVQVTVVTQQYSRIADTPIRAALVGNARAFIIFNTGDRTDVERLAHDIGLSSVAVEAILRYPRPDQLTGQKYSEFCYFHTDPVRPICGTVRYICLTNGGYNQQTNS